MIEDIKEIHFKDLDEKFASPGVTSVKEHDHMFDYYFGNLEKNIIKARIVFLHVGEKSGSSCSKS